MPCIDSFKFFEEDGSPANFETDTMEGGVGAFNDQDFTYEAVPPVLKAGILLQGPYIDHPNGAQYEIVIRQPTIIYLFFQEKHSTNSL